MKTILFTLLTALVLLTPALQAQSVSCNNFCVLNVEQDTNTATIVNVEISMSGTSSDFINYPYVAAVTDGTGDTLANGSMEFFAQVGNTTQTYHPHLTSLPVFPPNFVGTVHFRYDFDTVQCLLPYPCITAIELDVPALETQVFPNPTTGKIVLKTPANNEESLEISIYSATGAKVLHLTYPPNNNSTELDLARFPQGLYYVQIKQGQESDVQKVILQK